MPAGAGPLGCLEIEDRRTHNTPAVAIETFHLRLAGAQGRTGSGSAFSARHSAGHRDSNDTQREYRDHDFLTLVRHNMFAESDHSGPPAGPATHTTTALARPPRPCATLGFQMPDSQTVPAPDRAMLILANAVAEIVGSTSPVFQHIVLAAGSQARSDHARARETFDSLPGAQRRAVQGKAETTATAIRQQMVLRGVLKNLPRWRPETTEWIWPLSSRPRPSNSR